MPTARAPRASQLSRVSFQPRAPQTSRSISLALAVAVIAAVLSLIWEGDFGFSVIECSIIWVMKTETFQSIGTLVNRIAARLKSIHQGGISTLGREGAVMGSGNRGGKPPTVDADRSDVGGTRCGLGNKGPQVRAASGRGGAPGEIMKFAPCPRGGRGSARLALAVGCVR